MIKMPKTLLVGGGITSSLIAYLTRNSESLGSQVEVWEKSRGSGGRMSTSRNSGSSVDLGAQYISSTSHYQQQHKRYYDELLAEGVFEPLEQDISNGQHDVNTKNYAIVNGASSLVKFYLERSGCSIQFNHHLSKLNKIDGKWVASTLSGVEACFDQVILTQPVPQVLQLKGTIADILEENQEIKKKLEAVEYSTRFAVGLYYEEETVFDPPYISYVNNDPIFRYFAVDNMKRNRPNQIPSVCVHTSAPYGALNEDKTISEIEPELIRAVETSFPNLFSPRPTSTKVHKWKYSQVTKAYEGQPGAITLSKNPLLIIGGDGFSHSNLDGCITSAEQIVKMINKL